MAVRKSDGALAGSVKRERGAFRVSLAVDLVDLHCPKNLDQARVDLAAGKVRDLGSIDPQLHPIDCAAFAFAGRLYGNPRLSVAAVGLGRADMYSG